jgi:hypothetical protein
MANETYAATSTESFEDAVSKALPPARGPEVEDFDVTLTVARGGIVGVPQYGATLRRA